MDSRPLVKGSIPNFGIFLDILSFCVLDNFFRFSNNLGFLVFLVHPETTLPDGLEPSGQRAHYQFWHISKRFWVFAFWIVFFSVFKKKSGFWVFLVHPIVVSVQLSVCGILKKKVLGYSWIITLCVVPSPTFL